MPSRLTCISQLCDRLSRLCVSWIQFALIPWLRNMSQEKENGGGLPDYPAVRTIFSGGSVAFAFRRPSAPNPDHTIGYSR